jgi:hypothetical protein
MSVDRIVGFSLLYHEKDGLSSAGEPTSIDDNKDDDTITACIKRLQLIAGNAPSGSDHNRFSTEASGASQADLSWDYDERTDTN